MKCNSCRTSVILGTILLFLYLLPFQAMCEQYGDTLINPVDLQGQSKNQISTTVPFLKWEARYDGTTGKGTANVFSYDDVLDVIEIDQSGNVYLEGRTRRRPSSYWSALSLGFSNEGDQLPGKGINIGPMGLKQVQDEKYSAVKSGYGGESQIYVRKSGTQSWDITLDHPTIMDQFPVDEPVALVVDESGNVYVLGIYRTDDAWDGSEGLNRWIIVKLRGSDGSEIWRKYSDYRVTPYSLILDALNNVIVSGTKGTVKYDNNGNQLCSIDVPFYNNHKAAVDPYGNFYLSSTTSTQGIDPLTYRQYSHKDIQVTKYNGNCNELWKEKYIQHHDDEINQLLYMNGSLYILIKNQDVDPYDEIKSSSIVKYSDQGAYQWNAGMDEHFPVDMVIDNENYIYASSLQQNNSYSGRSAFYKFDDQDGTRIWREEYTDWSFSPFEIMCDAEQNIVIAGTANSIDHLQPNSLNSDIVVLKYIQAEDFDEDGIPNVEDNCPFHQNPDQTDEDQDGVGNECDNCVSVSNADQKDTDLSWDGQVSPDGYGDACDNCPEIPNSLQSDEDLDGIGDECDNCKSTYNPDLEDTDGDGVGDVCDNCPSTANGPLVGTCEHSSRRCVGDGACGNHSCIMSQIDTDGDGIGDACDPDDDDDGIPDIEDNCPRIINLNQDDLDGDGIGDLCNDGIDQDGDEWADNLDNCPDTENEDQVDENNNGIGDACEVDLTISRIEITQAIQKKNQSIPILYGKDTHIRVYLDVGAAQQEIGPVNGMIRFFYDNGLPMYTFINYRATAKTLYSTNSIIVPPDSLMDPENVDHTLNFTIPGHWAWDKAPYIRIDLFNNSGIPESNPYNNNVPDFLFKRSSAKELNVVFVPIKVINGNTKCTPTNAQFNRSIAYVRKTYPTSNINIWKSETRTFDKDPSCNGNELLFNIWRLNLMTNDPVDNLKYHGLVCDANTVGAACNVGGKGGYAFFNNDESWSYYEGPPETGYTVAHELGHNFGRDHVPSFQGDPDDVDENYPSLTVTECYSDNSYCWNRTIPSSIGAYGFDGTQIYPPDKYYDFMSYDTLSWVSPYTYKGLYNEHFSSSRKSTYPLKEDLEFNFEDQEYMAVIGIISVENSIDFYQIIDYNLNVDEQESTPCGYYIKLTDENSELLYHQEFCFADQIDEGGYSFVVKVPVLAAAKRLSITYDGKVLVSKEISNHKPVVHLLYPNGGEVITESTEILWESDDPDNDSLTHTILFSKDNGKNWQVISLDEKSDTYLWNSNETPGSKEGRIRVIASDGVYSSFDDSDDQFEVADKIPEVVILSPSDSAQFYDNQMIKLEGFAYDPEDGSDLDSIKWISDIDGLLGTSCNVLVDSLTPGYHLLSLSVVDSDQNQAKDEIHFFISTQTDSDNDGISDEMDNCPYYFNEGQEDADKDGIGDMCDLDDSDKDGIPDFFDNCPFVPNTQLDRDQDGIGDACDDCTDLAEDDANNIIINGNFEHCNYDPWILSLSTEHPSSAQITQKNGELNLLEIVTSAEPKHSDIQLVQSLSNAQLKWLRKGFEYTLSCQLQSVMGTRPVKIVFGQHGDNGIPYLDTVIQAGSQKESFSFDFLIPIVFSDLRLTFGIGADTNSIVIDDIKLLRNINDSDSDGIEDYKDNCPLSINSDQLDSDEDKVGDACDNCLDHPNANQIDSNNNGKGDACDTTYNSFDPTYSEIQPIIYPNPAQKMLYIYGGKGSIIKMYNATGIIVHQARITSEKSDLSVEGMPDGIYLIELSDGKCVTVRKVIIQK